MSNVLHVVYALMTWDAVCILGILKGHHNRNKNFSSEDALNGL